MDRSIPHVRDIFGHWPGNSEPPGPQVQVYEYSPRSRRRHEERSFHDFIDENHSDSMDDGQFSSRKVIQDKKREQTKKKNRQIDDFDLVIPTEKDRNSANNKHKDSGHYSSRTLTDKDIRHLERHLSMKKTIRKQISRNLAQAFVEDPKSLQGTSPCPPPPPPPVAPPVIQNKERERMIDRSFTLTRAKVSKSEQNVLELLKDSPEDLDSGHCSPVHQGSSDDDANSHDDGEIRASNARHVPKPTDVKLRREQNSESRFSSFWKMFSVKGKGKR